MLLNEDFLNLYEELSELNESKADTQKLIDFAGETLANRFLAIKSRLKAPENDLYYWIKNKTPEELEYAVAKLEASKSSTAMRKEAIAGGELVCETDYWKVYHITTFEASQYYGRDTRWCITGINDWGDRYWKDYINRGIKFYFLIAKENYDSRGDLSKVAIAIYPGNKHCEVFDQRDNQILFGDVPGIEDINIPGVPIEDLIVYVTCRLCGDNLPLDNIYRGTNNEAVCQDCFESDYFKCAKCNNVFRKHYILADETDCYCFDCMSLSKLVSKIEKGYYYSMHLPKDAKYIFIEGAVSTIDLLIEKLFYTYLADITAGELKESTLEIFDRETGELVFSTDSSDFEFNNGSRLALMKDVEKYLKKHEAEAAEWELNNLYK